MIIASRGIVFSYIKFRDTSIIVRIFTEAHGLQSYIVSGIRSTKAKRGIGNYQPFSLLEIVAYWSENKDLHRLSDSKILVPTSSFFDVKKSVIILFLCELLNKVLVHETDENKRLFKFLWDAVMTLEDLNMSLEHFHIRFMIRLSGFLGFDLSRKAELQNLAEGDRTSQDYLASLDLSDYYQAVPTSAKTRTDALNHILSSYYHHVDGLSKLKSLPVLQQIFR